MAKTLEKIKIHKMAREIGVKNSNLNHLYFEGKDSPHYCVRPIVDILIEKLSKDLPVYEIIKNSTEREILERTFERETFEITEYIKSTTLTNK